jgi:hypothetical protein
MHDAVDYSAMQHREVDGKLAVADVKSHRYADAAQMFKHLFNSLDESECAPLTDLFRFGFEKVMSCVKCHNHVTTSALSNGKGAVAEPPILMLRETGDTHVTVSTDGSVVECRYRPNTSVSDLFREEYGAAHITWHSCDCSESAMNVLLAENKWLAARSTSEKTTTLSSMLTKQRGSESYGTCETTLVASKPENQILVVALARARNVTLETKESVEVKHNTRSQLTEAGTSSRSVLCKVHGLVEFDDQIKVEETFGHHDTDDSSSDSS